jgi:hypothetical protein
MCCNESSRSPARWHKYCMNAAASHEPSSAHVDLELQWLDKKKPVALYNEPSFHSPTSSFASARRELSVTLSQSQDYAYHSCALLLAKSVGQILPGADTPPFLDGEFFVCTTSACWLCLVFLCLASCGFGVFACFRVKELPFIVSNFARFPRPGQCNSE